MKNLLHTVATLVPIFPKFSEALVQVSCKLELGA